MEYIFLKAIFTILMNMLPRKANKTLPYILWKYCKILLKGIKDNLNRVAYAIHL
jgi:hypothetical protein